ncbi:MAG: hypothetical protein FJY95_07610 [Candidatus Handelsmanbacteria bacterium]|nr:hypothetical protein [Candidatus Handelsmanbacteria bacterium]
MRPSAFCLNQSYPNPANPTANITYELADPVLVRLNIFDLLGRQLRRLAEGAQPAGQHAATWEGLD